MGNSPSPQESKKDRAPKTESNPETGTKRHLRPLDAFSGFAVRPKCICGRGSAPNPAGGAFIILE